MKSILRLSLALVALALVPTPMTAAPKGGQRPSPSRSLIGPQGALAESHYRPRVRMTLGKATGQRLPLVATFSTMRGHVDRIEVRVDGKVIGTLKPAKPLTSGEMNTAIDLSKLGPGPHRISLWAWQGREGYRRLHGESKTVEWGGR